MQKELFISSSPHETKVAVLEDDQVAEVYYERDTGAGLAGGIYKGRVSRVLPGMQSAFVDIGLERDAFLYVSDFFEDSEEYDTVVSEVEARVSRYTADSARTEVLTVETAAAPRERPTAETGGASGPGTAEAAPLQPSPPIPPVAAAEAAPRSVPVAPLPPPRPSPPPVSSQAPGRPTDEHAGHGDRPDRGRRRRRRGRGFAERRFTPKPEAHYRPPQSQDHAAAPANFEILPGESLAKYAHTAPDSGASLAPASSPDAGGAAGAVANESGSSAARDRAMRDELEPVRSSAETEAPESPTPSAGASAETVSEWYREATPDQPSGNELPSASASREPFVVPEVATAPAAQTAREATTPATTARQTDQPARYSPAVSFPRPAEPQSEPRAPSESSAEPAWPADEAGQELAAFDEDGSAADVLPEQGQVESSSPEQAGAEEPPLGSTSPAPPREAVTGPSERTYTLREPHRRPQYAPRRGGRGRRGGRPPFPRGGSGYTQQPPRPGNNQPIQISELLKEGQEILVQIAKEPLGNKGARITSHIALPGRYLVYMPTIQHIGVSRKIASEEERLRLRNVILENRGPLTGGFIVRTAGAGKSEEEFRADLKFLATLWNEIRTKAERTKAPALLHRDLELVQRILRDILSPDFKLVRVDNEVEYERILDFVSRCQPSLVGHVKLYDRATPLFEEFGIQAEIDKALKPKVWLKSGGFIVINQTEALVAIDVNTGKYVGKTNRLEDTIVKTNIDAVKEIVRQIRLRDLGGIIVIDFIDMDERRNRQKVVQALEEALRHDRAPTNILSINEFGLVALTRKRVKQSLERTLSEPCAYCTGSGWIKSATTVCLEILAEARKMASQLEGKMLTLRVNPEVARILKSREGVLISELEALTRKDIVIKSDSSVHQERFEIF